MSCDNNLIQRQVKVLTDIRQGQRAGPIHSCVAVDIDHSRSLSEEFPELGFELGVPIEDVHIDAINRIQADILLGPAIRKPLRTGIIRGTVDDVRDVVLGREALS